MTHLHTPGRVLVSIGIVLLLVPAFTPSQADDIVAPICSLAVHDASLDLEEAVLDVQLYRSTFDAFEEIYAMIALLVKDDAVDKMTHLKALHDRDAAKLDLERADLQLIRQEALIEQLQIACVEGSRESKEERTRAMKRAHLRYLQADCDQQAKAIEVAEVDLAFNKLWLESILDLHGQVSTRRDVIRAQLDVTLEEQRRDDARRRTRACRAVLQELEGGDG